MLCQVGYVFPSLERKDCTGGEVLFCFAGSGGKERESDSRLFVLGSIQFSIH